MSNCTDGNNLLGSSTHFNFQRGAKTPEPTTLRTPSFLIESNEDCDETMKDDFTPNPVPPMQTPFGQCSELKVDSFQMPPPQFGANFQPAPTINPFSLLPTNSQMVAEGPSHRRVRSTQDGELSSECRPQPFFTVKLSSREVLKEEGRKLGEGTNQTPKPDFKSWFFGGGDGGAAAGGN